MRAALPLSLLIPLLSHANPIIPTLLVPPLQTLPLIPLHPHPHPHPNSSTLARPSLRSPINFPVPNTAVNLTFTHLGSSIAPSSIASAINSILQEIRPKELFQPNDPIAQNRFQYLSSSTHVHINIITYLGKKITYLQLSQLLYGLQEFAQRGHEQELGFEIGLEPQQGRVGNGTILLRRGPIPPSNVSGAMGGGGDGGEEMNNTALILAPAADNNNGTSSRLSASIFPVPATLITLYFQHSGDGIPLPNLAAALTNALRLIRSNVHSSGEEPIPDDGWVYRDRGSYVGVLVVSDEWYGGFVSWQVLSWALGGLLEFMTADGGANAKGWGFAIHVHDVGRVGSGVVEYLPRSGGSGGSVE
ncbi:MAG: hypothetical protein Q9161_005915 [Pseudevernia consocians]